MLFWYTPQIRRFQNETAAIADCAQNLVELQLRETAALSRQVQKMRGQIVCLESELVSRHGGVLPSSNGAGRAPIDGSSLDRLHFELQDRFRGSEAETSCKLGFYLRHIQELTTGIPVGNWLDLGCGRGEWLTMASGAGYPTLGVDSNVVAVAYCQARGLNCRTHERLPPLPSPPGPALARPPSLHLH